MHVLTLSVVVSLAIASCAQSGEPPSDVVRVFPLPSDATSGDAPTVLDAGPFEPAAHTPFPAIPDLGGRRIAHPQLVVITFADDPMRDDDERYAQWLASSDWLRTVGGEYGVTGASMLANVRLPDAAPTAITSTEIETFLAGAVDSGRIPAGTPDTIHLVFFPATTQITMFFGSQSSLGCRAFGAYHGVFAGSDAGRYAYAAIATCTAVSPTLTDAQYVQVSTSHEVIEAATDTDFIGAPAFRLPDDTTSAWAVFGGELADFCNDQYWRDPAHVTTRVWSNAAAAAGRDPCIPLSTERTYFNVSPANDQARHVSAGEQLQITLTGWSTEPIADWQLGLCHRPAGGAGESRRQPVEQRADYDLDRHRSDGCAAGRLGRHPRLLVPERDRLSLVADLACRRLSAICISFTHAIDTPRGRTVAAEAAPPPRTAVAIAVEGLPLVRSQKHWDDHFWADGGPPEALARRITVWEAWNANHGWRSDAPSIPGLFIRRGTS